jgi:HEAT repeat protein
LNAEERVTIRIAAIEGLGKIGSEEAVDTLLEVIEKADEHYHYKAIIALGKTRSKQALPVLLEFLQRQESRRPQWHTIRDMNIDGYTDEQMEDWRKRLGTVKP